MEKVKNELKLKIDKLLKDNGDMLVIIEEDSELFDRVYYKVKLKKSRFIDVEYHPINVTDKFTDEIAAILSEYKVFWNNTRTTFWIE